MICQENDRPLKQIHHHSRSNGSDIRPMLILLEQNVGCMSHEKHPLTFHYSGWLVWILIIVY